MYSHLLADEATSEEFDDELQRVMETVEDLKDRMYEFSSLTMEIEETSSPPEINQLEDEEHRMEQELNSIAQSLLSDVEDLEQTTDRLRSLEKESQDRLEHLKERSEIFDVLFGGRAEGVQQWIDQFEERRRAIDHVAERIDKLGLIVHELTQIEPRHREEWESEMDEVSSVVRDIRHSTEELRKWRNRITHRRSPRLAFRDLSEMHFDPGMRDTVVDAIAFFLRAASVVGADPERILEDAITANIQTQQRDRVLDTVDVAIETADQEQALESAEDKHSYEQFSNAEIRALFESEDEHLDAIAERVRPSHQDLIDRVLDEPSYVEEGLRITAMQVPIEYYDLEIQVDLVGEDADEEVVLIDVIESASEDQIERKVNQLETLLREAEIDEDRPSRGLVIVDTMTDGADWQHTLDSSLSDEVEVIQIK